MEETRIAKVIARAGVCSRRMAEELINQGRVKVKNVVINTPAIKISNISDVLVDDQPLSINNQTRLWLYNKPRGLITTHNDPQNRETIFNKLPKDLPRVISVGRLDYNTEGLLLLTSDGELSRYLELPSTSLKRVYLVKVYGRVDMNKMAALEKGITIDGVRYKPMQIELEEAKNKAKGETSANSWLRIIITEGKNREIRKILEYYDLQVNRLIRIEYGPFALLDLVKGQVKEIPTALINKLEWKK